MSNGFKDLAEAMTIFAKYSDTKWPTNCTHDELAIMEVDPDKVSDADKKRLEELDFLVNESEGYYFSFRFGSA